MYHSFHTSEALSKECFLETTKEKERSMVKHRIYYRWAILNKVENLNCVLMKYKMTYKRSNWKILHCNFRKFSSFFASHIFKNTSQIAKCDYFNSNPELYWFCSYTVRVEILMLFALTDQKPLMVLYFSVRKH